MREPRSIPPSTFFFLVLPMGISVGYASVTLPFVLTRAGFSVGVAASIVAVGVASNLWRFLWGPLADLTLTLRKWYGLAVVACAATLLLLSFIPARQGMIGMLTVVVFISQVAATLVVLPVGGLMAHAVAEEHKGRAAGWFQAGNLGGTGLGGGAGVWLASHFSSHVSGFVLAASILLSGLAIYFVPDVRVTHGARLGDKMREIGKDFLDLLRTPVVIFSTVLICTPIGAAGASNLWSSIAPEWRASADTVALVTGLLSGVASAVGCVSGGYMADRVGRWWAFFGAGSLMALVAVVMAFAPRTPVAYSSGVLSYAVTIGMAFASFSAVLLHAIGRGAASTKYAIMSSLGNLPCVYMTAFDGWAYDRWRGRGMLNAEAAIGAAFVVIGLLVLARINARAARPALVEVPI